MQPDDDFVLARDLYEPVEYRVSAAPCSLRVALAHLALGGRCAYVDRTYGLVLGVVNDPAHDPDFSADEFPPHWHLVFSSRRIE
ncbi:hypothetical protein [Burkholderia sp. BE12]|uniref:hypothetical protein n=1 Tax=Burkholderia sp. BE12 TaxID=2082394 RepID=UPI001319E93F|nr:hypothetical protein [Burkholderia sp. BE12]